MTAQNRIGFAIGVIIMLTPYIFWFFLGEDSFVLIHDNLDSEFVYLKHILQNDTFFNLDFSDKIEGIMDGVPRMFFRTGLNLTILLFAIFPPVVAYITNHLIVHLLGYIGMFVFLNKVINIENPLILLVSSISFGMVSYYHIQYGVSIAGQPLLIYAFYLILTKKDKLYHWIIIAIFPFFSFLVVTLPFFVPILLVIALIEFKKTKRVPLRYMYAILVLVIVNLFVEYQLFYATFIEDSIQSHRVEANNFVLSGEPSWDYFWRNLDTFLKQTHYHSGSFKVRPILVLLILGFLVFRFKLKKGTYLVSLMIGSIILWVAANHALMFQLRDIGFLKTFNSERFYFVLPFLWLLLQAMLLKHFFSKKGKILASLGIAMSLVVFYSILDSNKELQFNLDLIQGKEITEPTFRQFFAQDLFAKIKEDIKTNNRGLDYFLSVGMHPSVAQFNGLNTLDSYQNNYDLAYKKVFGKLISDELAKNKGNRQYFEFWGSRCYYFSSEIGRRYLVRKNSSFMIKDMSIDPSQFKEMKGRFLISAVPIENASEIGFDFVKSYENDFSYWKLHLYEVH